MHDFMIERIAIAGIVLAGAGAVAALIGGWLAVITLMAAFAFAGFVVTMG